MNSFNKLRRLARYLVGTSRLLFQYKWQEEPTAVDIYVDTDFAGCKETRRSTRGGAVVIGGWLVKHWAKTQTTISLSSSETERHGKSHGMAQALGIQSLMRDMGWDLPIVVHSNATAAIGIARRKGLGKIRHIDVTNRWIRDKVRSKLIGLTKVLGADNPADMFTKYVERSILEKALAAMNLASAEGRPACAPAAMGHNYVRVCD